MWKNLTYSHHVVEIFYLTMLPFARRVHRAHCRRMKYEHGAVVKLYVKGKNEVLGG